ncbi:TPA: hypothetical protein DCW38_05570 [candidate division WOR-3 bacterium]|jgi:predicted anti-sigma-YlaC factor YlaD|uniref:Putative zinc-finger domain-containing protein n=1 Tax=candidate division WOR-3 bacterium TaxID=2052148 RepID=A0A350HAR7_UNCW3|nr:hypothetical protein [candidate division WOR-3 bacterium]
MKHYEPVEISKYIDNELKTEIMEKVKNHLSECSSCRSLYEEYSAIKNTKMFSEAEVPEFLFAKINETVLHEKRASFGFFRQLVFALMIFLFFVFSFTFSLNQGRSHFAKQTASSSEQIADEFISNISFYPSGSLLSTVSYIGR